MPHVVRTLLILFSLVFARAGYADVPEQTLSTKEIQADHWTSPRHRAEQLALVGESLMLPHSLDFALEVFTAALKLDPRNARAGFYVHAFAPLFTLKGYMSRVQPLVDQTHEDAFIHNYYQDLNRQWPYFRGDVKDIATDRDLRQLLGQLGEAWGAARGYLAKSATPLTLHTAWIAPGYRKQREEPAMVWEWHDGAWLSKPSGEMRVYDERVNGLDVAARFCKADQPEPGVYHLEACPYLTVRDYALDFADIEALRGYAAGHQLLGFFDTAYNTDGLMKLWGRSVSSEKKFETLTDVEMSMILINAGAGALESDHQLARVRELGTDVVGGVKWLMRFQNNLCAPRPGFVLSDGICLTGRNFDDDDLKKALALAEATLSSSPIDVSNGHGTRTQVRMDLIFDTPVANLRQVAPHLFNAKGQATDLPDPTLNGIFPHADAPKFYRLGGR